MEDCEIIDLYWARSQQAIAESEGKYGPYCRSIARGILSLEEDAEECVNDTWLGAWNAMPVQRPERLSAFLGRITRNLALNRYRADRADKRGGGELPLLLDELGDCVPSRSSTHQEVEYAELERQVDRFLHTLPAKSCNVFLRRYWYAETVEEIARRYHMQPSAVKSSLFRSREKLRQYLIKEGIPL